ncbi:MAG TPA: allantoate amidohydrolase [Streptosporangiaceae bacterium]|nr:allantoate amidohydrolase [Streptosporangiaceae bacterium]
MTTAASPDPAEQAVAGNPDHARIWQSPLWQSLLPLGRSDQTGGYRRFAFTPAEQACRDWFLAAAADRGLGTETDRNGNLWAWWDPADQPADGRPAEQAVAQPGSSAGLLPAGPGGASSSGPGDNTGVIVTGSHLDSVPDGGAFDGPLGVVSAFAAIDLLVASGAAPVRPVGIAAFTEEEGARFGLACLGSRLLTGAVSPDAARALTDADGVTLADAMAGAGLDPASIGPDPGLVSRIMALVELHIEQGSALDGMNASVGVAGSIWPHGRWKIDFTGRADHAGTTKLADRRDPMMPYAATVLAARTVATELGALATFGKVVAEPGAANAICSSVHAWLDARAPDEETLKELVSQVTAVAELSGAGHGVMVTSRCESLTPVVEFDLDLRDRVVAALAGMGIEAPVLPTGAGHDAGVLAAGLPTAMLFVRNPSGVSHSPAEHAEPEDCEAGVVALAAVLEELACR